MSSDHGDAGLFYHVHDGNWNVCCNYDGQLRHEDETVSLQHHLLGCLQHQVNGLA